MEARQMTVKPRRPMGRRPGQQRSAEDLAQPRNLRGARKASRRLLSTCGSRSPWWPNSIAISTGWRDTPA